MDGKLDAGMTHIENHHIDQLECHELILMISSLFEISPTFLTLSYLLLYECRYASKTLQPMIPIFFSTLHYLTIVLVH